MGRLKLLAMKKDKTQEGKWKALNWFSVNKIDYRSGKSEYRFPNFPQKEYVKARIDLANTTKIEDTVDFEGGLKEVIITPYYITSPEKVIEHYGDPFFFAIDTFESFANLLYRIAYLNNVKYPRVGYFKLTEQRWRELIQHLLKNPSLCRLGVDWNGEEFLENNKKYKRAFAYGMSIWKDPKEKVKFNKIFKFTVWNTSGIRTMLNRYRMIQVSENTITPEARAEFNTMFKNAPKLGRYWIDPKKLPVIDDLSKDFLDLFRKIQWLPHNKGVGAKIRIAIELIIKTNIKPTHKLIAGEIGISVSSVRRHLMKDELLSNEFAAAKVIVDRNQIAQAKDELIEDNKKITINAIQRITDPKLTKGAIKEYLNE